MTLQDLRFKAQMAQFSETEIRSDILRLIERTGELPGTTPVEMDELSVSIAPALPTGYVSPRLTNLRTAEEGDGAD